MITPKLAVSTQRSLAVSDEWIEFSRNYVQKTSTEVAYIALQINVRSLYNKMN